MLPLPIKDQQNQQKSVSIILYFNLYTSMFILFIYCLMYDEYNAVYLFCLEVLRERHLTRLPAWRADLRKWGRMMTSWRNVQDLEMTHSVSYTEEIFSASLLLSAQAVAIDALSLPLQC